MKRTKNIRALNLHKDYKLNIRLINRIVLNILKFCKKLRRTELEFIFLDDKKITSLNKKYKARAKPTDVLTFNIDRREFGIKKPLGEAFISIDRAYQNSKKFRTLFGEEFTRYMVHAMLHLSGYDDESPGERSKMTKKEDGILRYLWKKENLSKVLTPR